MSAVEAWLSVMKLVRRFGWPREREALEAMPLEIRLLVESIGWTRICWANAAQLDRERAWFCMMWDIKKGVA